MNLIDKDMYDTELRKILAETSDEHECIGICLSLALLKNMPLVEQKTIPCFSFRCPKCGRVIAKEVCECGAVVKWGKESSEKCWE